MKYKITHTAVGEDNTPPSVTLSGANEMNNEQRLREAVTSGGLPFVEYGDESKVLDSILEAIKASGLTICGEGEVCVPKGPRSITDLQSLEIVDAVLSSLKEEGLVCVPVEANEAMDKAATDYIVSKPQGAEINPSALYAVMIQAAQQHDERDGLWMTKESKERLEASGLTICGEGEVCVPISQNSRGFCIYNGPCEYRLGRPVQAAQQQSSEVEEGPDHDYDLDCGLGE